MILVYGGSFDPPHLGHLNIIKALRDRYPSAYKILIYPNAISPLKLEKSLSPEEILILCKLTFQEVLSEQIELKETEIFSLKPSYTIDTIRDLMVKYPEDQIWLCIGEDSLHQLSSWYQYGTLLEFIEGLVVLRRKTKSPLPIPFPNAEIQKKSMVLDNELWEISSTRLRKEREMEYAKHWMKPSAFQYLQSKKWFS